MENVNFQPSGEEIERALMDLGPLLGVSIKEEAPDEQPELNPLPPAPNNAGASESSAGTSAATAAEGEGKESADSLASPGAPPQPPSAARCAVCNAVLLHAEGTPKLMECLHSICEPCLKAKIEEKQANSRDFLGAERITITCPQCRLQCQPANMIDQRFVIEKMVLDQPNNTGVGAGAQQCNSCEEPAPATSYCVDCAEFICDNCVHAHQRLKITKDHTIKSKEEAVAETQGAVRSAYDMYCREHVQERLSLFCETCDRLTCRDCQLQHHRDHKYQFSEEMATQARASIAALVSEVSYKRVLLGSAMKVIRDRQDLIADKKKALVHEITQTVVKLTNAINTRGKQLVLRLNEVCDSKQRTLSEKKEALEQLARITDHCVAFVGGALTHGSDTALLHAKRPLAAHLQRIKARRADIPNPEIPVRITLALDKLPDLVRVLSNIGAIVVDGKVDGGGGGPGAAAQGPYHPPGPAPAPAPAPMQHSSQHNAVVALHHAAAMHQSYVSGTGSSGGGGVPQYMVGGALRPLRHAHVTSTTHPHHLHGMSEMNLRGLLNAAGARARPPSAHAMHAYHQMLGAYGAGAYSSPPASQRRPAPRTPSPAPPPYLPALAKWHIPQHNGATEASPIQSGGADYKITLGRAPSAVTSTNPKTPSPSLNGGVSMELDKVCAESVQDLMATIAKLDSNGVQVVAEPSPPAPSPHVHSSTDEGAPPQLLAGKPPGGNDPNEDWCAVCMDGGELMCCDKCPKVFHQYCHIPTIDKLPAESESWQCLLCAPLSPLPSAHCGEIVPGAGLPAPARRLVERLTLELYCQYEISLVFREPVPSHNTDYHSKISSPMCLDTIRMKLQPNMSGMSGGARYTHVAQFVADCRLMFRNATAYNPPDSQIYKDAKRLEEFFVAQLVKWLPQYAYWSGEGDPPHKRPRIQ